MIQTQHGTRTMRTMDRLATLKESYRYMVASRAIDLLEQDYTSRGEAFFHVSGAGHEATATIASLLTPADWLHCHYREKALMLARGISIEMFFLATFNKRQSHSGGRQMNAHMSAPDLNIMSMVGPVGNSALQSAGVAASLASQPEQAIVLCGLGDGTTQQGEVYEGIAHAVRDRLPVLFVVQDNDFAISTKTRGRTFYSTPNGQLDQFYGIPIVRVDGRVPVQVYESFKTVIEKMRTNHEPAIIILEVERLFNHTNADDQRVYRSAEEIEQIWKRGDPITNLRAHFLENGIDEQELVRLEQEVTDEVHAAADRAQHSPDPEPVFDAYKPLPAVVAPNATEYRGDPNANGQEPLTMLKAIRQTLYNHLAADKRVVLFGEDIEDPKGDVFGITKGLSKKFQGRVINSPLAEASIIGISVGQALAGKRPVAFLQFADFLPIAFNQIFAEMGSMYWRTEGGWQAPVIVMITCGGYRPGLGPFHASTMESIAAHTPGIDVFMPSTAGDAAGMLNAAFLSGRPTLFFYPKSCLNEIETATSPDIARHLVPIGLARFVQRGTDLTLIGWGNTVKLCRKTADALAEHGVTCDVIDLRSLMPWDKHSVCESAGRTGRVIVVHEDNHTAGMGAELLATICETLPNRVEVRRITRADTFVPCNFSNQLVVLPSFKRTLEAAVEMLNGVVTWKMPQETLQAGQVIVEAIGSSPSDESITVIEWHAKEGDVIEKGAIIAELEADKAAVELRAPISGTVEKLIVDEGDSVQIGAPLARVMTTDGVANLKQITREESGTPIISDIRLSARSTRTVGARPQSNTGGDIGLVAVDGASGSRIVTNEDISQMCSVWSPDDIIKRTGIETRRWLAEGETALSIGATAVERLLAKVGLEMSAINLIICATETPMLNTPSMATLVQHHFLGNRDDLEIQAYDVNAACSGYIYALQNAYDYLTNAPDDLVLVVTTEALSPRLDVTDPTTAPIFADGASATLLAGAHSDLSKTVLLHRPVLGTVADDGSLLQVPADGKGTIYMDGPSVFGKAVRNMTKILQRACDIANINLNDLGMVVPHQANLRIIRAVRQRVKLAQEKVYSNIRHFGNTSSSTIPFCLQELFEQPDMRTSIGQYLGLVAFGGGFTFGGCVLETQPRDRQ